MATLSVAAVLSLSGTAAATAPVWADDPKTPCVPSEATTAVVVVTAAVPATEGTPAVPAVAAIPAVAPDTETVVIPAVTEVRIIKEATADVRQLFVFTGNVPDGTFPPANDPLFMAVPANPQGGPFANQSDGVVFNVSNNALGLGSFFKFDIVKGEAAVTETVVIQPERTEVKVVKEGTLAVEGTPAVAATEGTPAVPAVTNTVVTPAVKCDTTTPPVPPVPPVEVAPATANNGGNTPTEDNSDVEVLGQQASAGSGGKGQSQTNQGAGNSVAGQQAAGQQVAGQQVAGQQVAGQQAAGQQAAAVPTSINAGMTANAASNDVLLPASLAALGALLGLLAFAARRRA